MGALTKSTHILHIEYDTLEEAKEALEILGTSKGTPINVEIEELEYEED